MNKLFGTTLVSVCFAAITASTAMAQATPNPRSPHAAGAAHRHGEHSHAERPFSRPTERVEARLAYEKAALKITEAQHSQWDAYASLVRKNAQDMEQRFKTMHRGEPGHARHESHVRPNAIERLEKTQSFHAEAVTRINRLLAVEKPLYAVLSPEQQKVADVVLNPRHRSKGGAPMHGRGGSSRN